MDAKRIANMAMLVALAIIFSYVEFMIPKIRVGKFSNCNSLVHTKTK